MLMDRTYEEQLPPGHIVTIQLYRRKGGGLASGLIVGVEDKTVPIYRFDVSDIELGDYLCQLSGVSQPNALPYPFRLLDDGAFVADNWRAMDKLYPVSDSKMESLRLLATGLPKNPRRLVEQFCSGANVTPTTVQCDARSICQAIWPEESKTDIERLVTTRLKRTLNDTNNHFLGMRIAVTLRRKGDYVELDDNRE